MKWYKFSEQIPREASIYVTDWNCTWPAYQKFGDWKEFAKDNPEYAWAEIPIVGTPIEPKVLHRCEDLTGLICEEVYTGLFIGFKGTHLWVKCAFCPFCGFSPKKSE